MYHLVDICLFTVIKNCFWYHTALSKTRLVENSYHWAPPEAPLPKETPSDASGPALHTGQNWTISFQTLPCTNTFMPTLMTVSPQCSQELFRFSSIKNSLTVYIINLLLILGDIHCYSLFLFSRFSFFLIHTLFTEERNTYNSPNLVLLSSLKVFSFGLFFTFNYFKSFSFL